MNINEAFPSKYLKAADLKGGSPTVVIERVEMEMLGDDRKMVVYFQGKQKGLVTNKTNANTIADMYGDDTDDWIGNKIVLIEAMVDFQGKTGPAIRIRAPAKQSKAEQSEPPKRMTGGISDQQLPDEEIPF
jgi:arabinogalactan endo-1,4-beta-galactosidase